MPAPDVETLYDIETQVENAVVALLVAAHLPALATDSDAVLETPRIEVNAVIERQGPHEIQVPSGQLANRRLFDQFGVSLSLVLVTDPTAGQPVGKLRGKLRAAALMIDPASLNTGLSYLAVAVNSFRQAGGQRVPVTGSDKGIRSSMSLPLEVFIRPDAWPA